MYVPQDYKTELTITLQLWDPMISKLDIRTASELGEGVYYFNLGGLVLVGDYLGIIVEHRLLTRKKTAVLLHITL
jgi:hypothetical protein